MSGYLSGLLWDWVGFSGGSDYLLRRERSSKADGGVVEQLKVEVSGSPCSLRIQSTCISMEICPLHLETIPTPIGCIHGSEC